MKLNRELQFPLGLTEALANAREHLTAQRGPHGHWRGELSSSALSTATAVCALSAFCASPACLVSEKEQLRKLCENGIRWLIEHQNADGGWGDTTLSLSNISTTALCWAALAGQVEDIHRCVTACEDWLKRAISQSQSSGDGATNIAPQELATAIRNRYGKDHTFSVPILTTLALSGRLGPPPQAWRLVPQLPFELAAFPHRWYARLKLPVVSYALPALIAIGHVRFHHAPGCNLLRIWLRRSVSARTLRVLQEIQPASGGYLEAAPLTSFVCLSLIGAGCADHPVVRRGLAFLVASVRPDGSWAIDSDLATWVTTLSIFALQVGEDASEILPSTEQQQLRDWLLEQQYRVTHPYTDAAPGGWAWTDLPGAVPDADDTPGALLALHALDDGSEAVLSAARAGVRWLLDLQNSDGGIPTFCRGWGRLPFDRSSADLTAHALRAWARWSSRMPPAVQARIRGAVKRGLRFLANAQRSDGAWSPLWFGNQHAPEQENLVYGTSRVLLATAAVAGKVALPSTFAGRCRDAWNWLLACQNLDSGWGGAPGTASSIEETALALDALCAGLAAPRFLDLVSSEDCKQRAELAVSRGLSKLLEQTDNGRIFPPSPIGFYFAKLWYFEKLYPVVYSLAAFQRATSLAAKRHPKAKQQGHLR